MDVTKRHLRWFIALLIGLAGSARAAVLPEERADALYHAYDGGGVQVTGPSVLVRKNVGASVSVVGNYYVDHVSSASIDVMTQGSPYSEKRQQKSLGLDYLRGKTNMSFNYITSEESDYTANTAGVSFAHEFFGDLTSVALSYSQGHDTARQNGRPTFQEDIDRRSFRVSLSQIITKNSLMGMAYEVISDAGYLHNPYRSVRYVTSTATFSWEPEVYPQTRVSHAVGLSGRYYLPYRAALHGEIRIFNDTWGIRAQNATLGYTHPLPKSWLIDVSYRFYTQTAADFYSDLFPYSAATNFRARDKELSQFRSQSFGLGITYQLPFKKWKFIDKGSLNARLEHMLFSYDDYRDVRDAAAKGIRPGDEPLYNFSANVLRLFLSIWY